MANIATPIYGKNKVLFWRSLDYATQIEGAKCMLQTEHTLNYDQSPNTNMTKDGAITSASDSTVTLDFTAYASKDTLTEFVDAGYPFKGVNSMLKWAAINGKTLECWIVDTSSPLTGINNDTGMVYPPNSFEAEYMQGILESWSEPATAEDISELSSTLDINGKPAEGYVTLTDEQIDAIQYGFRDLEEYIPVDNFDVTIGSVSIQQNTPVSAVVGTSISTVVATIAPTNATNPRVNVSSSAPSVCAIKHTGTDIFDTKHMTLVPKAEGTALIKFVCDDSGEEVSALVTVSPSA